MNRDAVQGRRVSSKNLICVAGVAGSSLFLSVLLADRELVTSEIIAACGFFVAITMFAAVLFIESAPEATRDRRLQGVLGIYVDFAGAIFIVCLSLSLSARLGHIAALSILATSAVALGTLVLLVLAAVRR